MNFSSIKNKIKPHYVYTALFLIGGLLLIQIIGSVYGNNVTGYATTDDVVGAPGILQGPGIKQSLGIDGGAKSSASSSPATFMDPIIEAASAVITGVLGITGNVLTTMTTASWALLGGVFVFIAAMIYLGLDLLKFIKSKAVKILISLAVSFIAISFKDANGNSYMVENIANMSSGLVYMLVILLIIFMVWIFWNRLRSIQIESGTEKLSNLTQHRGVQVEYIRANVEKNISKMMAKTLKNIKTGETQRIPDDIATIEQNFRRIHGDIQMWLRTIEHHGDPNIQGHITLPSDWDQIKNQIQKAYVGINENLEKAKREIVTDSTSATKSISKANDYLQMYDALLGRLEHYASHNQLAQMPFTGRVAGQTQGTTVPAGNRPQGGSGSTITQAAGYHRPPRRLFHPSTWF